MHRIETYLKDKKVLTDEQIEVIKAEALEKVKKTYEESLTKVQTKLEDIFDYTYAELDDDLKEQRQEAIRYYESLKGGK
ncbi:UNVERIFIED_CONTAM: hypothetical protein O8I53_11985 [Campylobacter lari]